MDIIVLAQRHMEQRNRIESPNIIPHAYGQMIFDKDANATQEKKDNLHNEQCLENWVFTCKRMKLNFNITPCTNISSKWIKDLNVRPKTMKLLEEHKGIVS